MPLDLSEKLQWITDSTSLLLPELVLCLGILTVLAFGLFKKIKLIVLQTLTYLTLGICLLLIISDWPTIPVKLFNGMMRVDDFSSYFKILFAAGGILAVWMTRSESLTKYRSEYFSLILSIVLGANLLVMSMNFIMVVLSLELISISSYALAGFRFTKKAAEGSLKYFLFGSAATAVMIYGMSLLFGLTSTLDFSSAEFVKKLMGEKSSLLLIGGIMTLTGFFFKVAAAPMHLWAPDVYEASPTPVVAFFSVVPKLAGFGVLIKFTIAIYVFGQSSFDWQVILASVALLSIAIGNFSALLQHNPNRMMAYSSVAQTGFMLIGVAALSVNGVHFLLFYATVFLLANFLTFLYLQQFEVEHNVASVQGFAGLGPKAVLPSIFLLTGLISLTGLPPTAGFTSKLLVFTSLWEAYDQSGKVILLVLFVFGLINTVVALFFYLKVPYYSFFKTSETTGPALKKNPLMENLLGLILVMALLLLFFQPGLLMGWINRINFVL